MAPIDTYSSSHITRRQSNSSPPFILPNQDSPLTSTPSSSTSQSQPPQSTNAPHLSSTRNPTNNTLIIVGVIGGLIGTLIFIFLVWKCCYDPSGLFSLESRARWARSGDDEASDDGDSSIGSRTVDGGESGREVDEKAHSVAGGSRSARSRVTGSGGG